MRVRVFLHLPHYTRSGSLLRPQLAVLAEPFKRLALHICVIAKTGEPMNAGIFAEPRQLAFCVALRGLLNRRARLFQLSSSAQNLAQFSIADKIEWFGIFWQSA